MGPWNFGLVYGSASLALATALSLSSFGVLAISTLLGTLASVLGCTFIVCTLGLSPIWLSSLWARFMHVPDALIWAINGKRPFNFDQIDNGLYLGRQPRHERDVRATLDAGIAAYIVLNESWELCLPRDDRRLEKLGVRSVLHLPAPDYGPPSLTQIREAVAFIEANIAQGVYVHCNGGKGRSAVVVIAYLMKKNGWVLVDAYDHVKAKRKIANMKKFGGVKPQWTILKAYAATLPLFKKSS